MKYNIRNAVSALGAAAAVMMTNLAYAGFGTTMTTGGGQGLGQIGRNVNQSFMGLSSAAEGFCYVAAIFFLIMGILKFRAHKEDPRSTPLGMPVGLWICAVLFAFAPMVLMTGGATIWGDGAVGVSAPGSNY